MTPETEAVRPDEDVARSRAPLARVAPAVPVGGEGTYSYTVPDRLRDRVVPGVRVWVPFGGRRLAAMCVALTDEPPPSGVTLRAITGLVEDEPLCAPDLLELGRRVARRTGCSWGEALDAALPRAVKLGTSSATVEHVRMLVHPAEVAAVVESLREKRPQQARALRILSEQGGALASRKLMSLAHVSRSPLRTLAKAGHVELRRERVERDPLVNQPVARTAPLELTADQARVCARIVDACERGRSALFLLHGVTGSGKTEVYLQALAPVVAAGRQGIVLVPEISLTPQTVRRFRERFDRVAVLHSGLTDAERHDQWRRIRGGDADVVVGARSAIFAPVPRLGLIVIDEEHETTFKQHGVPRYHARDVAIERARIIDAVVVLGTATPSLEAYAATKGEAVGLPSLERLELDDRVGGGRMPEVSVVDLTIEQRRPGFTFLSDPLRAGLERTLASGTQAILFLNRRGWASVLLCARCRESLKCKHCSVSLTFHRRAERVICHYCGFEERPPRDCPSCGSRLSPLGFGTEKVEQEVKASFPEASVARMDSDTMSGRGAHEQVLAAFAERRIDVLIGTQMIAKGLDFPNATLVGVICADSALFLPDYRAAERTFQLLSQVIGRTGRGPLGGRVIVQAYDPRHIAIVTGVAQDYRRFAEAELPQRKALGYPPYGRLVRVVVHAATASAALARGDEIRTATLGLDGESVSVLGPAPAPIAVINDEHRVHVLIKVGDDETVARVLDALASVPRTQRGTRVLVDVDPVSML